MALKLRPGVLVAPKNAVPVGAIAGVQLASVLKSPVPGFNSHAASCERAGHAASQAPASTSAKAWPTRRMRSARKFGNARWRAIILTCLFNDAPTIGKALL